MIGDGLQRPVPKGNIKERVARIGNVTRSEALKAGHIHIIQCDSRTCHKDPNVGISRHRGKCGWGLTNLYKAADRLSCDKHMVLA